MVEVRARALSAWLSVMVCWAAHLMLRMLRQGQGDTVVEVRAQLLPCSVAQLWWRRGCKLLPPWCCAALHCHALLQQRSSRAATSSASRRACETNSCHPSAQPPGALHSLAVSVLSPGDLPRHFLCAHVPCFPQLNAGDLPRHRPHAQARAAALRLLWLHLRRAGGEGGQRLHLWAVFVSGAGFVSVGMLRLTI